MPGTVLIVKANPPDFTILDLNDERAAATYSNRSAAIGKDLFVQFPDNPDDPHATGVRNLTASLMRVIETRQPHKMSIQKYDIPTDGTGAFEERYWLPENIPVLGNDGRVQYIIHTVVDVTSTVRLEKKQKEAEREIANLSLVLERTQNAVILADADERVRWVNSAFISLIDMDEETVIGGSFLDLLTNLSDDNARCKIEQSISLRQPLACEIENHGDHGNWRFAKLETQPIFSESNQLIAFFAVFTDITQIKKQELQILKSEQRNRFILGNISEGIAMIDSEGVITELSPSGLGILKYEDQDLIGKSWSRFAHPDDRALIDNALREIVPFHSKRVIQFRFTLPTQNHTWLEATYHNFLNEPAIAGIVITFRDISKRKAQEELIRASEQNYKYLFSNNPAAIFIWHPMTFKIVECNEAAEMLTEYSKHELKEIKVVDLRPEDEHDRIRWVVKELERLPVAHTGLSRLITKTGENLYTDNYHHRIEFYGEDLVLSLILNMTDKVKLQHQVELEKTRKHIEITDAVLTAQENERAHLGRELHDNINQILTTARLYIEYALAEEKLRTQLMESSRDFIISAIKEVRELSKTLVPASLDENGLRSAIEDLIGKVKAVNTIDISARYRFDERKLLPKFKLAVFRIVQEQLNNIVKHSKASQASIIIKESSADLILLVNDNGIGFDPATNNDGLGFRNILSRSTLFGGNMSVNSGIGRGCELQVRFVNQLQSHVDQ